MPTPEQIKIVEQIEEKTAEKNTLDGKLAELKLKIEEAKAAQARKDIAFLAEREKLVNKRSAILAAADEDLALEGTKLSDKKITDILPALHVQALAPLPAAPIKAPTYIPHTPLTATQAHPAPQVARTPVPKRIITDEHQARLDRGHHNSSRDALNAKRDVHLAEYEKHAKNVNGGTRVQRALRRLGTFMRLRKSDTDNPELYRSLGRYNQAKAEYKSNRMHEVIGRRVAAGFPIPTPEVQARYDHLLSILEIKKRQQEDAYVTNEKLRIWEASKNSPNKMWNKTKEVWDGTKEHIRKRWVRYAIGLGVAAALFGTKPWNYFRDDNDTEQTAEMKYMNETIPVGADGIVPTIKKLQGDMQNAYAGNTHIPPEIASFLHTEALEIAKDHQWLNAGANGFFGDGTTLELRNGQLFLHVSVSMPTHTDVQGGEQVNAPINPDGNSGALSGTQSIQATPKASSNFTPSLKPTPKLDQTPTLKPTRRLNPSTKLGGSPQLPATPNLGATPTTRYDPNQILNDVVNIIGNPRHH